MSLPMIGTVRRCLSLVEAGQRLRWLGIVLLGVAASLFETTGAVLVFGLLGLVGDQSGNEQLPLVGNVSSRFPGLTRSNLLISAFAVVGLFFVVRAVVLQLQVYVQNRMAHNAGANLGKRLLVGYLGAPYTYHLRRNSSELIRNAYESVHAVTQWCVVPLVTLISDSLVIVGITALLAVTAPTVTLATIAFLVPLVLILLKVLHPRLRAHGRTSEDMVGAVLKSLQQSLHGFRDVRLLGRENFFIEEFSRRRTALARSLYLQTAFVTAPRVILETLFFLAMLVFLLLIGLSQKSTVAALAVVGVFAYAVLRILPALNRIVMNLGYLKFGDAALNNVLADLVEPVTRVESFADRDCNSTELARLPLCREIALEGVSFTYGRMEAEVLHSINLVVQRGESVGILGPTGSGKSTLVDLLTGLLQPTTGRIVVDGTDIEGHLRAWQRNLGVVSQSVFLLDDTLRRNIAFGVPNDGIDGGSVDQALRMAQLDSFVAGLPQGLDTVVGERGVRLSGGQRQRVAIARCLYRDPEVLIFDEGTSALDNLTEADVVASLERLRGIKTLVTVAHRLTTLKNCDRLVVVRAGAIVDVGAYGEVAPRTQEFQEVARS